MADAAMTVLLETLSHMLLSYSDLISGAEDDLRLLRDEVDSFRAFLRDAASKPKEEQPFRETERRIKVAVYNVQDTIDSYMMEAAAAQSKIGGFLRRRRRRRVLVTELDRSLAEEVRSLRKNMVKPLLDKARMDFPNLILEEPHQIVAEEMAGTAATALLENISYLIMVLSGGDPTSGDEEELRLLKNEVESLRVFLQNARMANKPNEDEHLREMERQICNFVYHAVRRTNSYLNRGAAARSKIDLFRRRKDLLAGSQLAEVVRSLREEDLKPVLEKARIDFSHILLIREASDATLEEPHQIKLNKVWPMGQNINVGVEDEQKKIIDYLIRRADELDVISIFGQAGLGKTTLARQIYESQQIQYEFPTRIWVTVSQNLNRKDVFLNILKEVTSKDMSSVSDEELASTVHHFLEKRKFLLVLDDVWSVNDFFAIYDALSYDNHSGKILVTSRNRSIARRASTRSHRLQLLNEEECWELLQLQVFGGIQICPLGLIEIGQDIARKCDGLALIVVIIGGIQDFLLSSPNYIV